MCLALRSPPRIAGLPVSISLSSSVTGKSIPGGIYIEYTVSMDLYLYSFGLDSLKWWNWKLAVANASFD